MIIFRVSRHGLQPRPGPGLAWDPDDERFYGETAQNECPTSAGFGNEFVLHDPFRSA